MTKLQVVRENKGRYEYAMFECRKEVSGVDGGTIGRSGVDDKH